MRLAGPILAAGLATVVSAGAQAGDWRETLTSALLEERVLSDGPGVAVLVRLEGETVFARGYGVRDLRSRDRIGPDTAFRLASVSKQFTAMAVALLVRDGKLRYEETLADVFPAFPGYGRTITIRHLLTHTSGLPDYEALMEAAEKGRDAIWTADRQIHDDEVLALLRGETKGRFPPGTSWAYSNSGYVVLGLAVARASGKPFADFLRQRIFRPLQMTHTLAYEKARSEVPQRAFGHTKEGAGFREADQSPTSATLGDGGVYSSVEDLARWDEALRTNELLSPAWMKPAATPVALADGSRPRWPAEPGEDNLAPGEPVSYGFGWFLDPWRGRPRMWHHGSTRGFRAVTERFTDDALTVVVLANRDDLDVRELALEIAKPYLGMAAPASDDDGSLGTGLTEVPRDTGPTGPWPVDSRRRVEGSWAPEESMTLEKTLGWTHSQTGQWGTQHDTAKDVESVAMTKAPLSSPVETFTIALTPSASGGSLDLSWGATKLSAPLEFAK